jgi:hypothetical protein
MIIRVGLADSNESSSAVRSSAAEESVERISTYSTESIARAVDALVYIPGNLLVYNPVNDTILVYSISNPRLDTTNICRRCASLVSVLAQSLWKNQRLAPHLAPLQIFFSEADFPYVDMQSIGSRNASNIEEGDAFCPWVQFGSVLRNSTILPTVQAFPNVNSVFCLEEWLRQGNSSSADHLCECWKLHFPTDASWDTLIPQVVWRGSDFTFLHTLRHEDFQCPHSVSEVPFFPRRQVVNMTNNGETWINASFPDRKNRQHMSGEQLSRYKYHIDLAGAGGTTWTGTLEKLAMPGLLFHHETPAKDWYFDSLKPWHHYVPIRTDLSDLKERYRWAEENQEEARAIAERGTAFAKSFFSYSNLQKIHEKYFGESGVLSKIVDAYEDRKNATLESILSEYQERWNISLQLVTICTRNMCDVRKRVPSYLRTSIPEGTCNVLSRNLHNFGQNMDQCIE